MILRHSDPEGWIAGLQGLKSKHRSVSGVFPLQS